MYDIVRMKRRAGRTPLPEEGGNALKKILCSLMAVLLLFSAAACAQPENPDKDKGDAQFEISDTRSVDEVYNDLLKINLQPVMAEYIYV